MSTASVTSKLILVAAITFIIGILVGYGIAYVPLHHNKQLLLIK